MYDFLSRGDFSWEGGGTLLGHVGIYIVKENHIGSAVKEILRYTKTDRLDILLL